MAIENKDQGELPQTSLSDASTNSDSRVLVGSKSSEPSGLPSDIIYTPPPSVSNMASSTSGENTSSPSNTDTPAHPGATVPASQAPLSSSTHPNINGASSNISKRSYIYFLPYPLPPGTQVPYSIHLPGKNPLNLPSHPFEPTRTLVLTSPLRTFVDIRVYKPFDTSSPQNANPGSSQRLEWAFAGTSTSVPIPVPPEGDSDRENVTHSTWTHWLDSRFPVGDTSIPVDEGDMYPLSDVLTLEVGHAFHPALGAVKTHEEMWKDEEIKATTTSTLSSSLSEPESGASKTKVCVVLRCQDDAARVRGVVVRVGQYVQGVLVQGGVTTVERWEWAERESDDKGEWQRTVRIGDAFLPCAVCFRGEILAVGGKVRFHEFEWVVEEVWEWV